MASIRFAGTIVYMILNLCAIFGGASCVHWKECAGYFLNCGSGCLVRRAQRWRLFWIGFVDVPAEYDWHMIPNKFYVACYCCLICYQP